VFQLTQIAAALSDFKTENRVLEGYGIKFLIRGGIAKNPRKPCD
jgi:hypothetical protein